VTADGGRVVALCGGVGGAKLALGLSRILAPRRLTIAVNTGDDFSHFGLPICPDLDTLMYTLGQVSNPVQGWGREGESWNVFETLGQLGGETWFQLGDRDLAVHLQRRTLLDSGLSLSEVTANLCRRFGTAAAVVLNKADLSSAGSKEIEEACRDNGLPLLASIPFILDVVHAVSQARIPSDELKDHLGTIWSRLGGM